jgi:apolipoprotein D and lipocalin family protein
VRYKLWGFFPLPFTWWVLERGDDYRWVIVSDPSFENVAILSRSPRASPAEIDAWKVSVRQLGYDTGKLEFPTLFPPGKG